MKARRCFQLLASVSLALLYDYRICPNELPRPASATARTQCDVRIQKQPA